MQDDKAINRLTAIFSCEIRNSWKPVDKKGRLGLSLSATSIAAELGPLKKIQRRCDIFLGRPRRITWRARMHMPRRWAGAGWNQALNAMGARYTNKLFIEAREILHEKEILISSWSLPASHAASYQQLVVKARENLTTIMGRGLTRRRRAQLWFWFWLACLAWLVISAATQKH